VLRLCVQRPFGTLISTIGRIRHLPGPRPAEQTLSDVFSGIALSQHSLRSPATGSCWATVSKALLCRTNCRALICSTPRTTRGRPNTAWPRRSSPISQPQPQPRGEAPRPRAARPLRRGDFGRHATGALLAATPSCRTPAPRWRSSLWTHRDTVRAGFRSAQGLRPSSAAKHEVLRHDATPY